MLVKKMAEVVRRHPLLMSRIEESTNFDEIRSNVVKHESTVEPNAHFNQSLTTCEEDSTIRNKHFRR